MRDDDTSGLIKADCRDREVDPIGDFSDAQNVMCLHYEFLNPRARLQSRLRLHETVCQVSTNARSFSNDQCFPRTCQCHGGRCRPNAALLVDLFDWQIRWSGPARCVGYRVHVGTADQYLAFYRPRVGQSFDFLKGIPLKHIAIFVEDLNKVEAKVVAQGLTRFNHGDNEPGRRFYFFHDNGIEFEVVFYR